MGRGSLWNVEGIIMTMYAIKMPSGEILYHTLNPSHTTAWYEVYKNIDFAAFGIKGVRYNVDAIRELRNLGYSAVEISVKEAVKKLNEMEIS